MITAAKANFESKNLWEVLEVEKRIEQNIRDSIEKGEFACKTDIKIDTPTEIRNRIYEDLVKLGYKVTISNVSEEEKGCPVDQCSHYDVIFVSWRDNDVRI